MQVLWELGIYPNLEMSAPIPFRPFKDWHRALDTLRSRLFVTPDTEQDARLQHAMRELLVETSARYIIKGLPPGRWPSLPGNLQQRYSPSRDDLPGFHGYEGIPWFEYPAMMYTLSHYRTDAEATALASAPGNDATTRRRHSPQDMTQRTGQRPGGNCRSDRDRATGPGPHGRAHTRADGDHPENGADPPTGKEVDRLGGDGGTPGSPGQPKAAGMEPEEPGLLGVRKTHAPQTPRMEIP